MKRGVASLISLLMVCLFSMTALADGKFAYVDMQRALDQIDEGKSIKAELKAEFDKKQKELDAKHAELQKEYASLEALAREGVVAPDKLKEKQLDLEQRVKEVTQYWQTAQKALSEKERAATHTLFMRMTGIVRGIAESDGFDFVFEKATLVYAPESLDITNELVRKYNAKYPAGSGAAKADSKDKDAKKDAKKAAPAKKK